MESVWIVTFVLAVGLCEGTATSHTHGKPLHLHMTREEVEHYFGITNHLEVPEYDVVSPFHSNDDGEFVSFNLRHGERQRRSLNELNRPNYKLTAFGKYLHLKLVRNERLMAPGLQFEERLSNGRVSRSPVRENTFYLGHVASDPDSLVAVSNGHGLRGLIRHKGDSMFIQPLPDHLARHFRTKRGTHPHLIYKATDTQTKMYREVMEGYRGSDVSDTNTSRARRQRHPSRARNKNYKYCEAGLIADGIVARKYGADKIANHLLLLGNMVAGMFLDKSIGKKKVVFIVNQIGTLDYKDLGVNITSRERFRVMRKHMQNNGKPQPDVYAFIVSHLTGGRAVHGSMCRKPGAGVVSWDVGLQSAGTVAHEIGHAMGLSHDGSKRAPTCPGGKFIMAPTLPAGSTAYTWSNCSSEKIQRFLNSRRSRCLKKPGRPPLKISAARQDKLPGEIVDADQQCQEAYGNQSFRCRGQRENCGSLFCTIRNWCSSNRAPVLDGSKCGTRSWCIRGECVDNGFPYVDGGWSEWSDFVPCTMECGGGVTYRERTCTNPPPSNGGNPCEGISKKDVKTCNLQPCPANQKSYRQQACESVHPDATPVYTDSCVLRCEINGTASSHGPVKNGARCTHFPQDLDVCIDRECRKVGCDHQFESGVINDSCGVCAGSRTSCRLKRGEFGKEPVEKGPLNARLIVELPAGTTRAVFEEKTETQNHIGRTVVFSPNGIQDSTGSFLIPPESKTWTKIEAGGTEVTHVTRNGKWKDQLFVLGPTDAVLRIMYIRIDEPNPGVKYMMYVPVKSTMVSGTDATFNWIVSDTWSKCSADCAGGMQTRQVRCSRSDDKSAVGDQWCTGSKPITERECNNQPCTPQMHLTRWRDCSKTCGKGVQTRSFKCRQKVTNPAGYRVIPYFSCSLSQVPDNVIFERFCREIKCPPVWVPQQDWSQCSTSCGPGIATRGVLCIQKDENGRDAVVPDLLCLGDKPPSPRKKCNLDKECARAT